MVNGGELQHSIAYKKPVKALVAHLNRQGWLRGQTIALAFENPQQCFCCKKRFKNQNKKTEKWRKEANTKIQNSKQLLIRTPRAALLLLSQPYWWEADEQSQDNPKQNSYRATLSERYESGNQSMEETGPAARVHDLGPKRPQNTFNFSARSSRERH
jgi:hypothetical protein